MKFKRLACILIAFLLLPFCRSLRHRRFLLVGGHEGELVAHNSKELYNFLTSKQTDYEVFWVLNRNSPDWKSVDTVISRGSIKNYLYFLTANGVFFSHTGSDVAPILHNFWQGRTPSVFLDHGIVGLKKAKLAPESRSSRLGPDADLWVCSSEFEKSIKVDSWGLPESRVKITGLARNDILTAKSEYRKEILFMPTWREWLTSCTEDEFVQTDFYRSVQAVLTSPRIGAVLEQRDFTLVVNLHFYFRKFIKTLDIAPNARVVILAADADVQDYIINSSLLITDYSSVAFDFLYIDKPVLFFQPDLDTYLELRGSYVDLRNELFGPQSFEVDDLARQIEYAIDNRDELVAQHRGDKERYFAFHDTLNCQRTFDEFLRFEAAGPGRTRSS